MSTQANKTNKTWLEKALALLNISEQDKLVLMKKRMEKYYKEEERKCNAHIERLERELEDYLETSTEKLDEIKEQEEQSFLEINLDKIATVELRDSYVSQLDALKKARSLSDLAQILGIKPSSLSYIFQGF